MHTSALLLLPLLGTVLVSATQYQARSSLDLNDGFLEILARDIQSREANLAVARRNLESEIQNKYYRRCKYPIIYLES